ncbi:winged helix DNA-binding protein [Diaminobutyricimonas aerilata]|uniref:Winged helix DNA-binding protein n=1 Tax=Diaminobutyricimonas aerilata TaxID=1162967 RepID=A0A2M9CHK4_9MICO|nr:transcriptional regulator [Diaminobutyricimonas aerilata]PJJ71394.1 winged helix DNA-binding protein [Diaminobutyricimonas aerilata]
MTSDAEHAHPRHRLDDLLTHPVRLSVVATLAAAEEAEFGFVRDTVQVSDSLLSKQVALLEGAGYVQVKKGYVGKRPRTWLRLSPDGRAVYLRHLEALRDIARPVLGHDD